MKRVLVVTKNAYLGQKIRLALFDRAEVTVSEKDLGGYDICFWDIDTIGDAETSAEILTMSRTADCDLPLPFSFDDLFKYFSGNGADKKIQLDGRICYLRGEKIKLTEIEAALLKTLISAGGEFISREEILRRVWQEDADPGIINVYIHYLREKLEHGEKIILSSRKQGYGIDKKFIGG